MSAVAGSLLRVVRTDQPSTPGHQDVQGDQGGVVLARQAQALLAAGGHQHAEPLGPQEPREQVADRRVVVHDERDGRGGEGRVGVAGRRMRQQAPQATPATRSTSAGRVTVKVEPTPARALDGDVAAHHLAEVAADHQAEAGPAVLPAGRAVSLGERLEQAAELLLGHADAGVGDGEG